MAKDQKGHGSNARGKFGGLQPKSEWKNSSVKMSDEEPSAKEIRAWEKAEMAKDRANAKMDNARAKGVIPTMEFVPGSKGSAMRFKGESKVRSTTQNRKY